MKSEFLSAVKQRYMVDMNHPRFGRALTAAGYIAKGEEVIHIRNCKIVEKSYLSVQVGPDTHILDDGPLGMLNHLCDPNIGLDFGSQSFIALRDISFGDVLGFFYPSTEWNMIHPFACHCGADCCLKEIKGAKYLRLAEVTRHAKGLVSQVILDYFKVEDPEKHTTLSRI